MKKYQKLLIVFSEIAFAILLILLAYTKSAVIRTKVFTITSSTFKAIANNANDSSKYVSDKNNETNTVEHFETVSATHMVIDDTTELRKIIKVNKEIFDDFLSYSIKDFDTYPVQFYILDEQLYVKFYVSNNDVFYLEDIVLVSGDAKNKYHKAITAEEHLSNNFLSKVVDYHKVISYMIYPVTDIDAMVNLFDTDQVFVRFISSDNDVKKYEISNKELAAIKLFLQAYKDESYKSLKWDI